MPQRLSKKIGCAALLTALAPSVIGAEVTTARVTVTPEYTRIVFESDAQVAFSLFALRNPDRLVLDLDEVVADSIARALAG